MNRFISKRQLILLLVYVLFTAAHTLAHDGLPEVVKDNFFAHLQRQREAMLSAGTSRRILNTNSNELAGAVLFPPPSDTFNSITAQWLLPAYSAPVFSTGNGPWYASEWVGIDGYGGTCNGGVSLQAGVYGFQEIGASGVQSGSIAWYEWSPNGRTEVLPFDAQPGHKMQVTVTANSASQGTVVLNNLSTGDSKTITVTPPSPSDTLCGLDAEWVVGNVLDNNGNSYPLSHFDNVFFQNCVATTAKGIGANLNGATLLQITSTATASVIDAGQLEVQYVDPI